ncbi:hypothetical protein [Polaribacter sp. Z022]|uniref:hypothetical protein n=1 Tax=Polaribacter sp. Z022 TaxID=2927125 RepID=UPI002021E30B|nr:hypothetical protein [Polaribacter sp. Z022]MCL7752700.1 hypothetical protein [Polaribacter sp. Z022]
MKRRKQLIFITLLILISFNYQTSFSQDIAQVSYFKTDAKIYSIGNDLEVKDVVLEDGKYTYNFRKKEILIEIKDGFYYEYHPNNKYIKAKIKWLSKYEYKLVITDIELNGSSFKVGQELTSEITKIRNNQYFYNSRFKNKTYKGSFIKIK